MASPDDKAVASYAVERWVQCYWRRPKDGRLYQAELQQNLFGDWVLVRRWSSQRSRKWGQMESVCDSYEEGLAQLEAISKRRKQRGYEVQA